MKISHRQKKWLKVTAVFTGILFSVAIALYYTIAFRFKETIQLIVDKESDGLYSFNASDINVSLANRQIIIKNASLTCKDTAETTPHYDVKIPDIFLSVQSLKQMILSGKLAIDTLAIAFPELKIHEHTIQSSQHIAFHASTVFDILQKLKSHLQIKSFSIHKASFNYGNTYKVSGFSSNRINLAVKNFSQDNNPDKSFLSSEEVDLTILNQHWKLPDGVHEISFTNLHFSGSKQYFEIDSCLFKGTDKQDNSFSISAQKISFNATQLADFYNKEELILDTLILYRPVINIKASKKEKDSDSSYAISQSFRQLLKVINFKYVDIIDGNIQLTQKNTQQEVFSSKGTNFKVYNLLLDKDSASLKVDSITLQQKNISFVTKDGLFKLNIEEFIIKNNSVFLKNASYEPTEENHNTKIFTFKSPLLKLTNINLEDLLKKKLTATDAELYEPRINFKTVKKKRNKVAGNNSDDKFYTTLHGLSELVLVQQFRIINGNLNFQSAGVSPMHIRMENINSLILLDSLFSSDSLIDVKRSLPIVSIGKVNVQSQKVKLNITDFTFEGAVRHNSAATFDLALSNGTSLKGKGISWIIFDWDRYRNHKQIQVNTMHIKEVAIATQTTEAAEKGHVTKDLPVIHLDRIDIDKVSYTQTTSNGNISLEGKSICMDEINSLKHAITWGNAEGLFNNIIINKPALNASIRSIDLNTQSETVASDADIKMATNNKTTRFSIPRLTTNLELHSTDFSHIHVPSLRITSPTITHTKFSAPAPEITSAPTHQTSTAFSIGTLDIHKANMHYMDAVHTDSINIKTGIDIQGENIRYGNSATALLSWELLSLRLTNLNLDKRNMRISAPSADITIKQGKINGQNKQIHLNTFLAAKWNNAGIRFTSADSAILNAEKISGDIKNHLFAFQAKEKLELKNLMPHVSLRNGSMLYKNKKSTIAATDINFTGATGNLSLSSFRLHPNTDAATLFKNTGWQTNHTSLQTGYVQVNGIKPGHVKKDSVFRAKKVVVNDLKLITIKDKQYPFKHGIEKPMLARMINNLKFPMDIDSVQLKNGSIYVHEITEKTHKEAVIPLEQVNALATHVRNRNNIHDSLMLDASLQLFNTKAHYFNYREAYGDSLSAFTLRVGLSPVALPELSQITMPFANINVISGKADTVFASWAGNKYAAAGKMNFIYDGLKIKVMSKKDSTRTTLLGKIESFLANDIALHKKNKESAPIFFVRDQEKSVFNFWVKTKLNGVIASAAILQRKKYFKEYLKHREKYYLPDIGY